MTNELRAGETLVALWKAGEVIDTLPADIRPRSRAEGYAAQRAFEVSSAHPIVGWKIAATNVAGQQHINVPGPLAGRLLAERTHPSGARIKLGHNRMRVIEPEFAFRMGRSLASRSAPYALDEVMAAVASLHPAIEVPDSRFADFTKAGEVQLVADNACAHEVVIGPAASVDWRALDLAAHTVRTEVKGKLVRDGIGRNVLDDPRLALTWLANELSANGLTLAAGQTVITGTVTAPLPIAAGDHVTADFGVLGRVEVHIG